MKSALRDFLPAPLHACCMECPQYMPISTPTQKTPCPCRRGVPRPLRQWRKFFYDVQPAEEKHSPLPAILHSMDTRRQDVRPVSGSLLLCIHSPHGGSSVSSQSILWLQLVAEGQQGFQLFHNTVLFCQGRKRQC